MKSFLGKGHATTSSFLSKLGSSSSVRKLKVILKWIGLGLLDVSVFIILVYFYAITQNKVWGYIVVIVIFLNFVMLTKISKNDIKNLIGVYIFLGLFLILCISVYSPITQLLFSWTGIQIDTWMNFLGALSGSVLTVYGAYLVTDIQNKKDKKEKDEYAKTIIDTFVGPEIESNISALDEYHTSHCREKVNHEYFGEYMKAGLKKDHYYNNEHISVEEFNKIKYDLIKYKSGDVMKVIKIYEMFYILKKRDNIRDLDSKDYQKIRQIYLDFLK